MVPPVIRGLGVLILVVVGALMLRWSMQRSALVKQGVATDAIVRAIYGDDPERSNEIWLEYQDQQGHSHWLHGKMAAHPRKGTALPIRYSPSDPERAMLVSEAQNSHYDFVTTIFGAYFLGYGLFLGYRLWKG